MESSIIKEENENKINLDSSTHINDTLNCIKNQEETNNIDSQTSKKKGLNFNPDDYLCLRCIGSGNFSEVFMAEHKETKILYTMKIFQKMRVEQLRKQEDVLMEKHVMEKMSQHENIIKYYGSAKDETMLYILYEYVNGGELWKRCMVYGLQSLQLIKYYFIQLLKGVEHMHSFDIVHRDIKVE
jgi:serine/threonine protein kinase